MPKHSRRCILFILCILYLTAFIAVNLQRPVFADAPETQTLNMTVSDSSTGWLQGFVYESGNSEMYAYHTYTSTSQPFDVGDVGMIYAPFTIGSSSWRAGGGTMSICFADGTSEAFGSDYWWTNSGHTGPANLSFSGSGVDSYWKSKNGSGSSYQYASCSIGTVMLYIVHRTPSFGDGGLT